MVHECLTECELDPSDTHNVMSAFNAKGGISSQDPPRKIQVHQRYVFARANQSTNHLIDRGANGRLAGADMRVLHNRSFTSKHAHPVDVWVKQGCTCCGGSAFGDTLNKALVISGLVLLCLISGLCEHVVHGLSILFSHFGMWDFMCEYQQHRIWTERSHIGGSCPWSWKLGRPCQDLGKIIVRSFSPCHVVVLCICYDLTCSLVTMHDCATCTLLELVMCKLWITESPKNGLCMFVHLLHTSVC